jgi:hypothetical protein
MAGSTPAVATGLAINGYRMQFVSVQPLVKYQLVDPNPYLMCGVLADVIEVITPGIEHHGWRVVMTPHPGELDILTPLWGFTESPTDTFSPVETLTSFTTLVRLKSTTANVITTTSCVMDKVVLRGQKGNNPMTLQMDILGKSSSEGSTFSPSAITRDAPYPFNGGVALSAGGTVRAIDACVLLWNNHIRPRFNNSVTADVLQNVRQTLHVGVNMPYTDDEDDLITTGIAAARHGGIALNLGWSFNSKRHIWDITKAVWPDATFPGIPGKEAEIRSYQYYQAVRTGSTALATITQDNT